jgi:hypothetical protein
MRTETNAQANRKAKKELARRLRSADPGLEVVHPDAAGIDVGNESHYVAVRPDRDSEPVRRFAWFTADLYRMVEWLRGCGVKTIAMQSTGVYWIPLYDILEERGSEVFLVNARHTKNLPGRKSDVQESQWLLKLHTYGLLNKSFEPLSDIPKYPTAESLDSFKTHSLPHPPQTPAASFKRPYRNRPCQANLVATLHLPAGSLR